MRCIAYYRVSTARQGRSGLGIAAQRETVASYLGEARPIAEFIEVESGKQAERPELDKALQACRVHRAALVVAKVDRLTRSVGFLSRILDSGVDVRFCDLPSIDGPAGRFMLQQMAAVAELEAGMISARTKAALKAAKARGVKLGRNPGNVRSADVRARGVAAIKAKATNLAVDLAPILYEVRAAGAVSLRQIAVALNERAVPTPRMSPTGWSPTQVQRVISRLRQNELALQPGARTSTRTHVHIQGAQ